MGQLMLSYPLAIRANRRGWTELGQSHYNSRWVAGPAGPVATGGR